jgi:hypothetical protein
LYVNEIFEGRLKIVVSLKEHVKKNIQKQCRRLFLVRFRRIIGRNSYREENAAMNNLTEIIEGVEKFAYEVLIWLLLIPKTLLHIISNPSWVPEYVARELNDKTDDRFDSFISPVILILISTLVPIAYLRSVPYPGAIISGPLEAHIHQPVRFVVDAGFVEKTQNYHYEWTADDQSIQAFDHTQLTDYVVFTWDKPGRKQIRVQTDNRQGESHEGTFTVNIFDENQPLTASIDDGFYLNSRNTGQDFMNSLQEPGGLFITFLFLTMPMLFALAIDWLRGVPFSRRSFMHSFYIQCYYFSPVTLAFWSLLLGVAYFIDTKKEILLLLLPTITILMLLVWLFVNETRLVMKEKNLPMAAGALFTGVCYVLITLLLYIYIKFTQNPEMFRNVLWSLYGMALAGFITVASFRSLIKLLRKLF